MDNTTNKNYAAHPVIVKARELSEAIITSEEYIKNMKDEVQLMVIECNKVISSTIRLDYGANARQSSGCCS